MTIDLTAITLDIETLHHPTNDAASCGDCAGY